MNDYKVVYNLLPHDTLPHEYDVVARLSIPDKETVGFSADDAGELVLSGNDRSYVRAWEPQRIGTGLTQDWFNKKYPGAIMVAKKYVDVFRFLASPTRTNYITQPFGARPAYYERYGLPGHEGIDFRAATGEKIMSVAPGVVSSVHPVETGKNYGIYVRVDHVGNYQTTYAHLEEVLVSVGDYVTAGSILGLADSTGNSDGSHLHLTLKLFGTQTIYPFNIVDPTPYLYK